MKRRLLSNRVIVRSSVAVSIAVCFVVILSYRSGQSQIVWYRQVAGTPGTIVHNVYSLLGIAGYSVTYDERSFIINNKRTIILSGSVHYPRSTPEMWDRIFKEMVKMA